MHSAVWFLSPLIEDFVFYRKASGRWSEPWNGRNLAVFDRHCHDSYPEARALSQEMVDGWCRQRATETNNSCRARIYVVVGFVRYLRARGLTEAAEPAVPAAERPERTPHAFTDQELRDFFHACDTIPLQPATPERRVRRITMPVFFRLLYSSGLRTTEARQLRVEDVDLDTGVLSVRRSKGPDQHHVVLHPSMLDLMRRYDEAVSRLRPARAYFFPAQGDSFHRSKWVSRNFNALWGQHNQGHVLAYDLRHHYATANINQWIGEGFGFDAKLLLLSKSMGHTVIESTTYYYSLVPALAAVIEDKTGAGFDAIVPEAAHG